MGEVLAVVAIIIGCAGTIPLARLVRREIRERRAARRQVEHAERVERMEGKLRALAEDIARDRGIPTDEAIAYIRAGLRDWARAQVEGRR